MPELPEVATTIKGLKPIKKSTISSIKIITPKLRFYIPKKISTIHKGNKIIKIKRKGKYILLFLSNLNVIIIHLGMSGRLRLIQNSKYEQRKHDHFVLRTNQDHYLIFNDPRKFGFVDHTEIRNIDKKKYLTNLGIDALDNELDSNYFYSKICRSIVPIKQILIDQRIIAGIGNIYASEILFNAKISPFKKGKELKKKECQKIIISIRKILNKAILAGGSTLRDYVSTDGTIGSFQNDFKVYNKSGKKIGGKTIKKVNQYGRSTFYCPDLQI